MKKSKTVATFSSQFLNEIRALLMNDREKIERELDHFDETGSDAAQATFPKYGDDEDSNVHEVEEFTVNKPLELGLQNNLRDTEKALKRLDDGTYGVCKFCDKMIDEKRLRARPTSSACVDCKKLLTDEA